MESDDKPSTLFVVGWGDGRGWMAQARENTHTENDDTKSS